MIERLRELLSQTMSGESPMRQEAVLLLALLIEKHSPRRDSQTYYENMIPPELLNISMSEEAQNELVHEIGRIVLSKKASSSLVWALTKSTSLDALEYLLAFFSTASPLDDEHSLRQALFGIEVFLSASQGDPRLGQILGLCRTHNLNEALDQLLGHGEADFNETIQRIKQKLVLKSSLPNQLPDEPPTEPQAS